MKQTVFRKDLIAQKRNLAWIFLATMGITGIQVLLPYLTKILIDREIPARNIRGVVWLMLISLAVIVAGTVLKKLKIRLSADTSIQFQMTCRNRMFRQYHQMPYGDLNQVRFGSYNTNMIQDVENLSAYLFDKIAGAASDMVFFVVSFLVLLWISPLLTGILYLFILVFTALIYHLKKVMSRYNESMAKSRSELNDCVHEMLSAQKIIAMNQIETHCMAEVKQKDYRLMTETLKANIFGPVIQSSVELATMVTYLITFLYYQKSDISLGEVFLFLTYLPQVWLKFSTMMDIANTFIAANVLVKRIYTARADVPGADAVSQPLKEESQFPPIRTVALTDTVFAFAGTSRKLLNQFQMKMESPGIYYIIGPSGIGKSTLFDLLLGFYRLNAGKILYNGVELKPANAAAARTEIALIPQDDYLFDGSIWKNITLGRRVQQEAVLEQIQKLGLRDYFENLPDGLATDISDGKTLSSGQKKAVAILRACCTRPSLLLFDELTSNLDGKSSADMERAVEILGRECICMYITHKSALPKGERGRVMFG